MAQGPKCPTPDRLSDLIDELTALKCLPADSPFEQQSNNTIDEAVDALDWLHTHLSNRKTYHKKHQLRNTLLKNLLREKLGEDYDKVSTEAGQMAAKSLPDHVELEDVQPSDISLVEEDRHGG